MANDLKTAVVALNYQRDLLPGGVASLHDKDILTPILTHAEHADRVIVGRYYYPRDHRLFERTVEHCIADTPGAQVAAPLRKRALYQITYGENPQKEVFSAFEGHTLRPVHTLEDLLQTHNIQRVIVGGYYLDTMVAYTAFDANALGYQTVIPLDSTDIQGDIENYLALLRSLRHAGVHILEA